MGKKTYNNTKHMRKCLFFQMGIKLFVVAGHGWNAMRLTKFSDETCDLPYNRTPTLV